MCNVYQIYVHISKSLQVIVDDDNVVVIVAATVVIVKMYMFF